jgi:hypothetical protein
MIWRLVTPGRIRVRTALRYSRMNWMSSRCHGAYFDRPDAPDIARVALNDRHGVLADLRQDLRVSRFELFGREVGLIVLRASLGWNEQQQCGHDQFGSHIGSHLVRACSCLARAGSCCLSLEGSIVGAGSGYERVTFSDAPMSASRVTLSAKPHVGGAGSRVADHAGGDGACLGLHNKSARGKVRQGATLRGQPDSNRSAVVLNPEP